MTDEFDDLDKNLGTEKEGAQKKKPSRAKPKKAEGSKVALSDRDKKVLDRKMQDVVDDYIEKKNTVNPGVEKYRKEGHRRFRCMVESTRSGLQHFELMIPHPDNVGQPIRVKGRCGVILEDGLTMYAINALKRGYHIETEEVAPDPTKDFGVQHKTIKVPNFRVEVYNEVENAKKVGTIG